MRPPARCPRSTGTGRRSPLALIALTWALLAVAVTAQGAEAAGVAAALDEAIRRARSVAPRFGLHVVDLVTGEEIAAVDAETPHIIASNTKLFTSAAALDLLGPGFLFETALLLRGSMRGETLVGDLAVMGAGDPTFSGRHYYGDPLAAFRGWARKLLEMGIRRIEGDVLLYHGAFEDRRVHPDWPDDQLSRCYEAPVDALSFNDNCVRVVVHPGAAPGRPARVRLEPELEVFNLRNETVTTSSARRHRIQVDRTAGTDEVVISGQVYRRALPLETGVTVRNPAAYFGAGLVTALAEEGVEVTGRALPIDALPVGPWWRYAVHRSDLLTALEVVNTDSQNFYAETVLKTLGRELCGYGSWDAGRRLVAEFVVGLGIEPNAFQLADGSGMSRENRFSARQLTLLLRHMAFHDLAEEFWRTLPPSGLATHHRWRNRLAREPYRGRVLAKTGSLSGVSTLSGYARALSGRTFAFSILTNDVRSVYEARRAQDRIVRALIDHG